MPPSIPHADGDGDRSSQGNTLKEPPISIYNAHSATVSNAYASKAKQYSMVCVFLLFASGTCMVAGRKQFLLFMARIDLRPCCDPKFSKTLQIRNHLMTKSCFKLSAARVTAWSVDPSIDMMVQTKNNLHVHRRSDRPPNGWRSMTRRDPSSTRCCCVARVTNSRSIVPTTTATVQGGARVVVTAGRSYEPRS